MRPMECEFLGRWRTSPLFLHGGEGEQGGGEESGEYDGKCVCVCVCVCEGMVMWHPHPIPPSCRSTEGAGQPREPQPRASAWRAG